MKRYIVLLITIILCIPFVLGAYVLQDSVTIDSPTDSSIYDPLDTFIYTCGATTSGSGPGVTVNGNWTYCSGTSCTPNTLLTSGTSDLTGNDADGLYTNTNQKNTVTNSQTITANDAGDYTLRCCANDGSNYYCSSDITITVNEPAGNIAPQAQDLKPVNSDTIPRSTNIILNATYYDPETVAGTVTFYNSSNNIAWCTNTSVASGTTIRCEINVWEGITVNWYVNVSDTVNNNWSGIYNFDVTSNNAPTITHKSPTNNTIVNELTQTLNITYGDSDSDTGEIKFYNASNDEILCTNNTISAGTDVKCEVTMTYSSELKWYVTANDTWDLTTSGTYNYTTYANSEPTSTFHGPTNNTQFTIGYRVLNITYNDVDSDIGTIYFYNSSNNEILCTNNSINTGTLVGCGVNLTYSQELKWYYNITNDYHNIKSGIYNYSTEAEPPTQPDKWVFNITDTNQIGWYNITMVWANATDGKENSTTPYISFEVTGGETNPCEYTSGDWTINVSDYCNITTNVDIGANKIIIVGTTGKLSIQANITAKEIHYTPDNFNGEYIVETKGGQIRIEP